MSDNVEQLQWLGGMLAADAKEKGIGQESEGARYCSEAADEITRLRAELANATLRNARLDDLIREAKSDDTRAALTVLAENEELRAEVATARKDGWEACETCHGIVDGKHPSHDELAALKAENASLKADAERYRWLTRNGGKTLLKDDRHAWMQYSYWGEPEAIDAAIDAAIASAKEKT